MMQSQINILELGTSLVHSAGYESIILFLTNGKTEQNIIKHPLNDHDVVFQNTSCYFQFIFYDVSSLHSAQTTDN
jgi:type I restriction-modification system DNA methylase subunit